MKIFFLQIYPLILGSLQIHFFFLASEQIFVVFNFKTGCQIGTEGVQWWEHGGTGGREAENGIFPSSWWEFSAKRDGWALHSGHGVSLCAGNAVVCCRWQQGNTYWLLEDFQTPLCLLEDREQQTKCYMFYTQTSSVQYPLMICWLQANTKLNQRITHFDVLLLIDNSVLLQLICCYFSVGG